MPFITKTLVALSIILGLQTAEASKAILPRCGIYQVTGALICTEKCNLVLYPGSIDETSVQLSKIPAELNNPRKLNICAKIRVDRTDPNYFGQIVGREYKACPADDTLNAVRLQEKVPCKEER